MKKQVIRLTEADLHRIIKESVNRILKEDETYVDKLRRQDAEKKASWDAWENTVQTINRPNIPTKLDDEKYAYEWNKDNYRRTLENRPEKNGFRTYSNFANEPNSECLKGFNAMQALDDTECDFYRNGSFWNGIKK